MIDWALFPASLVVSICETVELFAFHKKIMAVVIGVLVVVVGVLIFMVYWERKKRRS